MNVRLTKEQKIKIRNSEDIFNEVGIGDLGEKEHCMNIPKIMIHALPLIRFSNVLVL